MDFALTDAQRELAASARHYLGSTYPAQRVAEIADGAGTDPSAWPELVRQGWLDPDLGSVERGLLAMESGYALHPTPWWTTTALVSHTEQPSTLVSGGISADGGLLSGRAELVPEAMFVARFVVLADGLLFQVDAGAPGLRLTESASLDRLRRVCTIDFDAVPARPIGKADVASMRDRAGAMLACEAVGVAARAMDFAVDYAKTREQFGRPIGSFQAVAHQLADGYAELELARSLAYRAAWMCDSSGADADGAAVDTAVIAGRNAAIKCCEIAIQTLGGMGVTWEHPLHHWFRRALWLQAFTGIGDDPHEMVAAGLLGAAAERK